MSDSTSKSRPHASLGDDEESYADRRDFLHVAAYTTTFTGCAACAAMLSKALYPPADPSANAAITFDLKTLKAGEGTRLTWHNWPVFVYHRTYEQRQHLQSPEHMALLEDPLSKAPQQPHYAQNWHRSTQEEFGVYIGICTHFGCIPSLENTAQSNITNPSQKTCYHCPCHGSYFDLCGRVYRTSPAPLNLPVPPHHITRSSVLKIGENPAGSDFTITSIKQL